MDPTGMTIPGRVALVTAASAGIGRASAQALARAGAEVAILARGAEELERAAREISAETGARIVALPGDLREAGAAKAAVRATEEALGPVEILVLNVGGPRPGGFFDLDDAAWRDASAAVLEPALSFSRAVLPKMRAARFGRIVHVLSLTVRQPVEGLVASNVLRPAVAGLVGDLAREVAVHGITVNGVCPGYTRTRRLVDLGAIDPQRIRAIEEMIPAGRLADPEEIAGVVAFLASERAAYVTGALIPVDGGLSARPC